MGRARVRAPGDACGLVALAVLAAEHGLAGEVMHLRHDRAAHLHGVVLLGFRAKVSHMVGRVVDAANESQVPVHHHDLAMHAAQQVQPLAQETAARVKDAKVHAGLHQAADKLVRQIGRAKAVHQHMHLHAPPGGRQQRGVQLLADLVLEQDEGFQHDLAPGFGNGLEHAGKELLAVFEQLEMVAGHPAGRAWRAEGRAFHSRISAARGAWSESLSQGFLGNANGECTVALRT